MVIATQGTQCGDSNTGHGLHDNELGFTGVDSEELTQANVSQCLHSVCMRAEWYGWSGVGGSGVVWCSVEWVEWCGVEWCGCSLPSCLTPSDQSWPLLVGAGGTYQCWEIKHQ